MVTGDLTPLILGAGYGSVTCVQRPKPRWGQQGRPGAERTSPVMHEAFLQHSDSLSIRIYKPPPLPVNIFKVTAGSTYLALAGVSRDGAALSLVFSDLDLIHHTPAFSFWFSVDPHSFILSSALYFVRLGLEYVAAIRLRPSVLGVDRLGSEAAAASL